MAEAPEKPEHWDEFNALAGTIVHWHDAIQKLAEPWSDEKIRALMTICEQAAKPGESYGGGTFSNFEMPIYLEVVAKLRGELHVRHMLRRMEELGIDYYCVHCDGACTPEHAAEMKESD